MADTRTSGMEQPQAAFSWACRQVSHLAAPPDRVWSEMGTFKALNDELWPWIKMTCPEPDLHLDQLEVVPGETVFRSSLMLFGVFPVDLHDLSFGAIRPGEEFQEVSSSMLHVSWRHERRIEAVVGGCRVTDHVAFQPRAPLKPLTPALIVIVRALFAWRHRRLRQRFGG